MNEKENKAKSIWIGTIIIALVLFTAVLRYQSGEIDYLNSDATWHTLLTIECYNETPISDHLFLPIVSMGGEDNKFIPWGATIPDTKGNYYYTSFSPAGYFIAWLFIRILRLPVEERSLYIFNNGLFAVSALLLMWLLLTAYERSKYRNYLCFVGVIVYICLPELLHGLGFVYWSQSLMQVTLLLQIICYYRYVTKGSLKSRHLFYVLSLINPYIEWTGYVANVGFAITELIINWKIDRKKAVGKGVILGLITTVSFGLFCIHYLMRVDGITFFKALQSRFIARNVTTEVPLTDVIGGYLKSFLYSWVLLGILVIWCFTIRGSLEIGNGMLFFVMAFPILENVIMKEHALTYTYDRMKAGFVLILLICEVVKNIFEISEKKRALIIVVGLAMVFSILNFGSYMKNKSYIWSVDYRENNKKLAEYITNLYQNAVYASDSSIRGYMNLLFQRGIYELTSVDIAKKIALDKGKENVIYITTDGYKILTITAYNVNSTDNIQYTIENGEVSQTTNEVKIQAADWTDINWTNGYSNFDNILLFYREDSLLIDLLSHKNILANNKIYTIKRIDYDDFWIRVECIEDVSDCMYPAVLQIK